MKNGEQLRVIARARVDNEKLVRMITGAARAAARNVAWNDRIPAGRLPGALHRYVRTRTRYSAEQGEQIIRRPNAFRVLRVGDCKTTAVFIAALAAADGRRVELAFTKSNGEPWYSHVYAIVDGVVVDPLLSLGQEVPFTGRKLISINSQ